MTTLFTGQPQNVNMTNQGEDVADDNPLPVAAPLASALASLDDVAVTTTAATLGSLAAGPTGIMLTAHPSNTSVIRVSGADVGAAHGQPLGPSASVVLSVKNANLLQVRTESGAATLCVSAV